MSPLCSLLLRKIPQSDVLRCVLQVRSVFRQTRWRCLIIGRRFTIAHVTVKGQLVEVSSFSTNAEDPQPPDAAALARAPRFGVRFLCCHHAGSE